MVHMSEMQVWIIMCFKLDSIFNCTTSSVYHLFPT